MNATLNMFFHVPLVGWLLNDAVNGAPDAKYYFAANLVLSFILLLYLFGYPFLICFALTSTAIVLTTLVFLTAADFFDKKSSPAQTLAPRRP